jgi:hypothetical protein
VAASVDQVVVHFVLVGFPELFRALDRDFLCVSASADEGA